MKIQELIKKLESVIEMDPSAAEKDVFIITFNDNKEGWCKAIVLDNITGSSLTIKETNNNVDNCCLIFGDMK